MQACLIVYIKIINQSFCVYSRLNADFDSLILLTLKINQWIAKKNQFHIWYLYNLIVHYNYFTNFTHFDISCFSIKMLSERCKNTFIYQFITSINNTNKLFLNSNNKKIWCCQKCINFNWHQHPQEWITSKGIVIFVKHLIKNHNILIIFLTQTTCTLNILYSTKFQ